MKKTTYYNTHKFGWLKLTLDERDIVIAAVFVDKPDKGRAVPDELKKALASYLQTGKAIPKRLYRLPVGATDFQTAIWRALTNIPLGKTVTYTELATKAGRPRAGRAAGTACGKNPLALFVPCHRIVRKAGTDSGYAWGADKKKAILEHEAAKDK